MHYMEIERVKSILQNELKKEFHERENLPPDFFEGDKYYKKLPTDIVKKVKQDFEGEEIEYVLKELHEKRFSGTKNSWKDHIIRTVLFLAEGDLEKIKFDINSKDTISRYMASYGRMWKSAKHHHYFTMTFDEMEYLNNVLQNDLKEEFQERDNLPPDLFEGDKYYKK